MLSKKELATVSNLRFISMKNFMISCVEHEKSFIISEPGVWLFRVNTVYKDHGAQTM